MGCQTESERIEPVRTSKIDEFVRNPVTYKGVEDTVNIAKIQFEEAIFDFGTIEEGEVIEHTFHFVNVGLTPLLISNASSTCGCTVPSYPKEAIAPNENGEILVKFNSENKSGYQDKVVSLFTNGYPNKSTLRVRGRVIEKSKNK